MWMSLSRNMIACGLLVIFVVTVGCSPRCTPDSNYETFCREAQAVVQPQDLQRWAISVMEKHKSGYEVPLTDLPASVRGIKSPFIHAKEPSSASIVSVNNGANAIDIMWGGGFMGHWGLTVGNASFRMDTVHNNKIIISEWIPGVYFFSSVD